MNEKWSCHKVFIMATEWQEFRRVEKSMTTQPFKCTYLK